MFFSFGLDALKWDKIIAPLQAGWPCPRPDFHAPQRMNPNDLVDPDTFSPLPRRGRHLRLWVKCLNNYRMDCEVWSPLVYCQHLFYEKHVLNLKDLNEECFLLRDVRNWRVSLPTGWRLRFMWPRLVFTLEFSSSAFFSPTVTKGNLNSL